ncbi:hypothetical protein [Planktotalea sp.]|uniref:hypothetical protein n=1 Tax=Planktotalea sp. TaxID=2029877 RepID=UPI003D6B1A54
MSSQMIFQDFSTNQGPTETINPLQSDPLEGYELGYKAGWDDALKSHLESKSHISTSLAQNLEQIEFTLAEAKSEVFSSLKPVLNELTKTLFPSLTHIALRDLIANEVNDLLNAHAPQEVSIVVAENDEATVAALLNSTRALSEISLVAKNTLGDGQAYISCSEIQRKVDVKQALSEIQETIETFLNQPELEHADVI